MQLHSLIPRKRRTLPLWGRLACAFAFNLAAWAPPAVALEFRSIDGSGNHPFDPQLGAAGTRVVRFGYDADYPDGVGDVISEAPKPNPRTVSNLVLRQTQSTPNERGLSDWIVHWGQFVTHDLSLIDTGAQYNRLSTGVMGDFSIPVTDPGDPLGPAPIPFKRSAFDPTSGNGDLMVTPRGTIPIPRWQINSNTSYLDASNIYGSDQGTADRLRTFSGGKLATSAGGQLPMLDSAGRFFAGDERANENVGLSAIHALFVREHNRLAERIATFDPTLGDEAIYQWARKIVGAEVQSVTYREFLPALMGQDAAPRAEDFAYEEGDASITTAFSTAAFRFGHSMQSAQIALVGGTGEPLGAIDLATATENPGYLTSAPGRVDQILKGLASQTAQENDVHVVDALRNIRFGPPGAGGTDLAAVDIQRGRDHGLLSSYRLMRQVYNLSPILEFQALTADPEAATALASLYGTTDNLDPFVAMIAEGHLPGSSLGSLAQEIISSQFRRLRDNDRFFYTGDTDLQSPLVLSVIDLGSVTLSQIIRQNSSITSLQQNVFFAVPEPGGEPLSWLLLLALTGGAWVARKRVSFA